jgi:hypothetical protein
MTLTEKTCYQKTIGTIKSGSFGQANHEEGVKNSAVKLLSGYFKYNSSVRNAGN